MKFEIKVRPKLTEDYWDLALFVFVFKKIRITVVRHLAKLIRIWSEQIADQCNECHIASGNFSIVKETAPYEGS